MLLPTILPNPGVTLQIPAGKRRGGGGGVQGGTIGFRTHRACGSIVAGPRDNKVVRLIHVHEHVQRQAIEGQGHEKEGDVITLTKTMLVVLTKTMLVVLCEFL